MYDERGSSSGQASGIPVNYAAAMAGLAGFQYPGGQGNAAAASAAFLNAAHYPAYAAQYNAALAAGYWPGTTTNNQTNVATAVNVVPQPTGTSVDVSNSVDVTAVGSSVTKTQSQQP